MFAGLDRVQLVGLFSADFFRVKIRFTVAHSLFFSLSFLLGLLSVSLTHSLLPLAIFTVRILFSALIFLGQFFSLFFCVSLSLSYLFGKNCNVFVEWFWRADVAPGHGGIPRGTRCQLTLLEYQCEEGKEGMSEKRKEEGKSILAIQSRDILFISQNASKNPVYYRFHVTMLETVKSYFSQLAFRAWAAIIVTLFTGRAASSIIGGRRLLPPKPHLTSSSSAAPKTQKHVRFSRRLLPLEIPGLAR